MKYDFKTKPYNHQVLALRKLLKKPRGGGLLMEMGTGKTKVAIDYACIEEKRRAVKQVLVLGPLSTLGVWDSEIYKHAPDNSKLHWKVINYDKARLPHYLRQLIEYCKKEPTLLICDEAHKLKNANSKQSKSAYAMSKHCVQALFLTGTPIPKHPLDLFAEMRIVDDGVLGSSYNIFKRQYAVWGGYGGYQLIKYINLKRLRDRVDPHIFVALKKDCLDLPKRTHEVVPVNLKKSRRVYESLARESVVEFEDGTVAEAVNVLARLTRLSQITGGWIRDENGEYRQVGEEKKEAFNGLVEEMATQERNKIVVFVRFLNELRDASLVCAHYGYKVLPFYGGVKRNVRDQRIAQFDESDEPTAFIAQIQAGSLGISLVAASEAIFYSHTFDYAEFAQACDRLHRIGQSRPVTYYHLIARDTVDEAVWLSLKTKRKLSHLVLQRPELLV